MIEEQKVWIGLGLNYMLHLQFVHLLTQSVQKLKGRVAFIWRVSTQLTVSSLLYPSRTKLLMENWTPLQFFALCRLNNPFHLLFIPLALLTRAVKLLWWNAECWSFEVTEVCLRSAVMLWRIAQQILKNTELILNCLMEMSMLEKIFGVLFILHIK